jgi:hypothetical protein
MIAFFVQVIMNQPEQILVKGLGKSAVIKLAATAAKDEKLYQTLLGYINVDQSTRAAKAAWVLSHVSEVNHQFPLKYAEELLDNLQRATVGGIQRELLKTLYSLKLPEKQYGKLIDLAFRFLSDRNTDVGVKYYATYILLEAQKLFPDLTNEFKFAMEETSSWHNEVWQRHVKKYLEKISG